jgi:hypothetical protein
MPSGKQMEVHMGWWDRVAENILPYSEAEDVEEAIKEWYYTGEMYDLEEAYETCQLCGHEGIRYQFEIENESTHYTLLIGSECITKFSIPAMGEDGELLGREATRKKVHQDRTKLIVDAKRRRLINALVTLASKDSEIDINDFIKYVGNRSKFTPKQASLLVWRLGKHGIPFRKSDFKIGLRQLNEKHQLRTMELWKLKQIWPCLSPSQKQWCEEHRDDI